MLPWMHNGCLSSASNCYPQYTKEAKESSCKVKDSGSGWSTRGTFNTSIFEELCYNQDQTELSTSWVECIEKDSSDLLNMMLEFKEKLLSAKSFHKV